MDEIEGLSMTDDDYLLELSELVHKRHTTPLEEVVYSRSTRSPINLAPFLEFCELVTAKEPATVDDLFKLERLVTECQRQFPMNNSQLNIVLWAFSKLPTKSFIKPIKSFAPFNPSKKELDFVGLQGWLNMKAWCERA